MINLFKSQKSLAPKDNEVCFVTTMNPKFFNLYGKNFIDSFDSKANPEIQLYNIFESQEILNYGSERIINKLFRDDKHTQFLKYFSPLYEANGLRIQFIKNENNQTNLVYANDFRWNAIKFSFKVFAINFSLQFIQNKKILIWTDADLLCHTNFDSLDLNNFFPANNELFSYLGRTSFPPKNPFSECGFIVFNLIHPDFHNFMQRMIQIYLSGEIFSIQQWHDSWIWDHVRNEFELKEIGRAHV